MIIKARNTLADNVPNTYTAAPLAVGLGTISVVNVNSFYANWAIQIGRTGEEYSEVILTGASAPSGTTMVLVGTTRFPHATDTPIYSIKYDQIVFERSTVGTSGTAAPMSSGTITITPDSEFTQIDDLTGAATYAYKAYFRNSASGVVSAESDWIRPSGNTFYSLAAIRDRVKEGFEGTPSFVGDKRINNLVNEWFEIMNNGAISVNEDYAIGTVDIAFGTAGYGTITATDFKEPRRMWITTNGSDFFKATKMDITNHLPNNTYDSSHPYFSFFGDNVMQIFPSSAGGTARIVYYKNISPMANDTDELPLSVRPYTGSFVSYVQGNLYIQDGKETIGERKVNSAKEQYNLFISQITPRGKTDPEYIDMVAPLSGDESFWDYL